MTSRDDLLGNQTARQKEVLSLVFPRFSKSEVSKILKLAETTNIDMTRARSLLECLYTPAATDER